MNIFEHIAACGGRSGKATVSVSSKEKNAKLMRVDVTGLVQPCDADNVDAISSAIAASRGGVTTIPSTGYSRETPGYESAVGYRFLLDASSDQDKLEELLATSEQYNRQHELRQRVAESEEHAKNQRSKLGAPTESPVNV